MTHQEKFSALRQQNPLFTYHDFTYQVENDNVISMAFDFRLGEAVQFAPKMRLRLGKYAAPNIDANALRGLVFHIGMIELISYWKAACAPTLHICHFSLNKQQQNWWKKLYWKGLGEFFYQNGIKTSPEEFLNFTFDDAALPIESLDYQRVTNEKQVLVPIGGGKDSVVTLEALRKSCSVVPFIINPRGATTDCARIAGFPTPDDIVILEREIAKPLLNLNARGYLNGHTPFSAMLAFYTLLASTATNIRNIALSNEASANEPTIPNSDINHQYSKSQEFETDFQNYVRDNMNDCAHYFSYLRPYSELQIAEMFAQHTDYHGVFKSCNAGSKENKWCCNCPKCLFAYIILSPFIADEKMIAIFGEDLLNKPSLQQYFDELTGIAEVKPFECVGTIDEVREALSKIADTHKEKFLVRRFIACQAL